MKNWLVLILCVCALKLHAEQQLKTLIQQMTLQEKVGQLNQLSARNNIESIGQLVRNGQVGSVLNLAPQWIDSIQYEAVNHTRLHIPVLVARDVIHGYKTIFPIPLGQACSFDDELVEQASHVAAIEARSQGIQWVFAPMIDVCHDPRWGRVAECLGEDTYLTTSLGAAMTRGFQGASLSDHTSVAACAKHFVGYGAVEGGRDYNSTHIPLYELYNRYLPPFREQTMLRVASFMPSFNDNDGVPSTASSFLLQSILREQWNYSGLVVSDWAAIKELINHHVAENLSMAAQLAFHSGVEVDMMGHAYEQHLEDYFLSHPDELPALDSAVMHVLELKQKLGLFTNPYISSQNDVLYSDLHLHIAQKLAEESVVLLKNVAGVLPISSDAQTIALLGPMANARRDQLGTWIFDGDSTYTHTLYDALAQDERYHILYHPILRSCLDKDTSMLATAREIASKSDVVVVCLGEPASLSGEAHCLADLHLQGAQSQLLKALYTTGKPIVAIIMAGRPLVIEQDLNNMDALLYAWHPGTMGGDALKDILFGKVNPSGKLSITIPKTEGQIPIYYNHNNTGRPAPQKVQTIAQGGVSQYQTSLGSTSYYLDYGAQPLFPFGYGLSYTSFTYSTPVLSATAIQSTDSLVVTVDLTNNGNYSGTEIVQLYLQDQSAMIARPVRELKRYQRVNLLPQQSTRISFTIYPQDLSYFGPNGWQLEPGTFQLWVGGNSQTTNATTFTLYD